MKKSTHYNLGMLIIFSLSFLLLCLIVKEASASDLNKALYCARFECKPQYDTYAIPKGKDSPTVSFRRLMTITAYNTVPEQTDSSPCVGAGGWVCGREDVAACPRDIPLGTKVEIDGMWTFTCFDRTSAKYNGRLDLNFQSNVGEALNWGVQTKWVTFLYE